MLQVYLVRHGETEWNVARRIQGQSDSPLTAQGEQQAYQVANSVKTLGNHAYIYQRVREDAPHYRDYCAVLPPL